jgi:hypothetical protein
MSTGISPKDKRLLEDKTRQLRALTLQLQDITFIHKMWATAIAEIYQIQGHTVEESAEFVQLVIQKVDERQKKLAKNKP